MKILIKIIAFVVALALCVGLVWFLTMRTAKKIFPLRYEEYIEQYSEEYNLDKYEVMSLIYLKSKYAPLRQTGEKQGLMQIPADTVKGVASMEKELALAITQMLGIKPTVHLVSPKSIARSEGKAVRVVDKRKLHD